MNKPSPAAESPESDPAPERESEPRRSFVIEIASLVIGGLVSLVPLLAGLVTFLDPLRGRKAKPLAHRQASEGKPGYVRVATLNALTEGGAPQRFPVIDDKRDAWNFSPDQAVGAVYIQWLKDQQVRVFNATCPHAGCSVACDGQIYHCPCHNSSFELDGSKRESESGRENPSPRSLDALAYDADKLTADGEVWVEFVNFYTGKDKPIRKS